MTVVAKMQPATQLNESQMLRPRYLECLNLVERLHRQLLDVIKDELDRRGERVVNSVQALLLFNIGDQELTAGPTSPTISRSSSSPAIFTMSART